MRRWPKSAYLTLLFISLSWVVSLYSVYHTTATAYRAVGINDGKNLQSLQLIEKINKISIIRPCNEFQTSQSPIELVSVKADTIFIINQSGVSTFCKN